MKTKLVFLALGIVFISAFIPPLWVSDISGGMRRDFHIKARQYAFDPPRITVNKGDAVHIRLTSLDVVHGFYLEGHDINALIEPGQLKFKLSHPSQGKDYTVVEEIIFTAQRPGKFRYRCSRACGSLHPFMQGEMIVRPNYPFLAGAGGAVGIFIATFVILFLSGKNSRAQQLSKEI